MGGPMLLQFLHKQTAEWKDTYIARVVSLNAAWGGTVQSIEAIAVGYAFGSSVIQQSEMRQVQRSTPSLHWLLPSLHFWNDTDAFMRTSKKNYTIANYKDFFM